MWKITVRNPDGEPVIYDLRPGINTVGRMQGSDIYIPDISTSRNHAEIILDPAQDTLTLRDLNSSNGTYLNQQRVIDSIALGGHDTIRIGNCTLTPVRYYTGPKVEQPFYGTHRFTRELLFESLDHHAVLMYEAARELNTVMDLDTALRKVAALMKRSMGAEKCEVILAGDFDKLHELGFPTSIARTAIDQRSAVIIPNLMALTDIDILHSAELHRIHSALCVPVMSGEDILGLIYLYKSKPETHPFEESDLQLAVAISHQAALTIQRTRLIEDVQRQLDMQHLLRRFLSPREADYLLKDYLDWGSLPGLSEQVLTILFADIEDSTGMAESLGARQFGKLLSVFYQEATEVVFAHSGLIKLLGDGVMAVFGEADEQPTPEERAISTGFEILQRLQNLGKKHDDQKITVGVAVNTGPVMAGYVGNDERVEYTVLGDTVNVAYRLQAHARPNRLVVGPETAAAVKQRITTRPIGEVTVRGREKPLKIFEIFHPLSNLPRDERKTELFEDLK